MIEKGAIKKGTREILDINKFRRLNTRYTEHAENNIGLVTDGDLLFSERLVEPNSLRPSAIVRAEPNNELFEELENIAPPRIDFTFPTNQIIVESDNPIEIKQQVDELQKKKEELDNLLRCVWKS